MKTEIPITIKSVEHYALLRDRLERNVKSTPKYKHELMKEVRGRPACSPTRTCIPLAADGTSAGRH
jgi:hypothetical protein